MTWCAANTRDVDSPGWTACAASELYAQACEEVLQWDYEAREMRKFSTCAKALEDPILALTCENVGEIVRCDALRPVLKKVPMVEKALEKACKVEMDMVGVLDEQDAQRVHGLPNADSWLTVLVVVFSVVSVALGCCLARQELKQD